MSEWWFNAVSATEAIFTARTCLSFKRLWNGKKQKEKQTTHKSLKRGSGIPPLETLSWHQNVSVPFPRRPVFLAPFLIGVLLLLILIVGLCCAYRRGVCKSCIPLPRRGGYRFTYRHRPGTSSGDELSDTPPSKNMELRSLAACPPPPPECP